MMRRAMMAASYRKEMNGNHNRPRKQISRDIEDAWRRGNVAAMQEIPATSDVLLKLLELSWRRLFICHLTAYLVPIHGRRQISRRSDLI